MSDDLHQLAGAYALDALDDAEARAFEAHLPLCSSCQDTVTEFRATAAELGLGSEVAPPSTMRAGILSQLDSVEQVSPNAAAPSASGGAGAPEFDPEGEVDASCWNLDAPIDLREQRRAKQERRRPMLLLAAAAAVVGLIGISVASLRSDDATTEVAAAADAAHTDLTLTDAAADLEADGFDLAESELQVIWSASQQQAHVVGEGLPAPHEGQTYELWFMLADGNVAAAGLFEPDDGSVDTVLDLTPHEAVGWAITLEPDGGSEQPTTDPILAGTI